MKVFKRLGGFFRKLGFDKGDERSVLIGAYAMRNGGIFTTFALLAWAGYELIRFGDLGLPAVLFFSSQTIYWFAYSYYRKRLGG